MGGFFLPTCIIIIKGTVSPLWEIYMAVFCDNEPALADMLIVQILVKTVFFYVRMSFSWIKTVRFARHYTQISADASRTLREQ